MRGAATGKARLPTAESLTEGTTRRQMHQTVGLTGYIRPLIITIGVASYGALGDWGTCPNFDFQPFNFWGHFRAAQTLTFDFCPVRQHTSL